MKITTLLAALALTGCGHTHRPHEIFVHSPHCFHAQNGLVGYDECLVNREAPGEVEDRSETKGDYTYGIIKHSCEISALNHEYRCRETGRLAVFN